MIAKGTRVRQRVPAIEGEVGHGPGTVRFNEKEQQMEYQITYSDGGEQHSRWFLESDLEAVK